MSDIVKKARGLIFSMKYGEKIPFGYDQEVVQELLDRVQELEEALIDAFKIDSYDPVSHEQFIEKYESLFKLAKLRETNDEASSL